MIPRFVRSKLFRSAAFGLAVVAGTSSPTLQIRAENVTHERFACTKLPKTIWLPLSTIVERINDSGIDIASARATIDDCYELRLLFPDGTTRTVIIHPVSGKPLS